MSDKPRKPQVNLGGLKMTPANVVHSSYVAYNAHEVNIMFMEHGYALTPDFFSPNKQLEIKVTKGVNMIPMTVGRFTFSPAYFKQHTLKCQEILKKMEEQYGEIVLDVPEGMS